MLNVISGHVLARTAPQYSNHPPEVALRVEAVFGPISEACLVSG